MKNTAYNVRIEVVNGVPRLLFAMCLLKKKKEYQWVMVNENTKQRLARSLNIEAIK